MRVPPFFYRGKEAGGIGVGQNKIRALQDSNLIIHGLAVSAYGLVVLAGLWVIHAILDRRPSAALVQITPNASTVAATEAPAAATESVTTAETPSEPNPPAGGTE